jgi:signal transduction histidine kinase
MLWNLLRNAVAASPPGASVSLRLAESNGIEQRLLIEVGDKGPGITSEMRERLFEPFATDKQGGSGLGLAVVHRIVQSHHGSIEFLTGEGGGTVARITMPTGNAG